MPEEMLRVAAKWRVDGPADDSGSASQSLRLIQELEATITKYSGQLDILVNIISVQAFNSFGQSFADGGDERLRPNFVSYVYTSASTPASCTALPRA
jgi:hypothetical protein